MHLLPASIFSLIVLCVPMVKGVPKPVPKPVDCTLLKSCTTCTNKSGCGWTGTVAELGKCGAVDRKAVDNPQEHLTVKQATCRTLPSLRNAGTTTPELDTAVANQYAAIRKHVLFGEGNTVGKHVFSTWDAANKPKPEELKFSTATSVGSQADKGKTFWIDTSITGLVSEDNSKQGTFEGKFVDPKFKRTDEKTDNSFVAQMCKASIRSAVTAKILSTGMQLDGVPGNKGKWTNDNPGVSFAVASPINPGQQLCVTVTKASCFPGSIHPASEEAGKLCKPLPN